MNIFFAFLFILGFAGGNILRISFENGVAIGLYDIAVGAIIAYSFFFSKLRLNLTAWRRFPALCSSIGIFFLVCIISLVLNSSRFSFSQLALSSLYLVRLLLYAFFSVAIARGREKGILWLKRIWIALVCVAVIGFIQYIFYPDIRNLYYLGWDPHYYRIVSTILDPNFSGILFALGVFLSFYLFERTNRRIFFLGGCVLFFALLLTYSRASYISFFAGLCIWLFGKKPIFVLGEIAVGIFVLLLFLPRPGGEGVKLERIASIEARAGNMRDAIVVIQSSPIFGVGFNTLRHLKGADNRTGIESHSLSGFDMSILFILSTTGVVGLIAFGNILYAIFLSIRKKYKKCSNLSKLVISSLFTIGVHGLSVNTYFYPLVLIYLSVLMGSYERNDA
jgi:O-antigen ligase